ncbi:hypothetical protein GOV04_02575 [Candidatus Woesearchaeota archaeon]|nr:hypothetical protein [Candidatus Woesearchaeota archaeon]
MFFSKEQRLLNYVKRNQWFTGVRTTDNLLFFSLRTSGERKHDKKFIERLLLPIDQKHVRVFNLKTAKTFHKLSAKQLLKDKKLLNNTIQKCETLMSDMLLLSKQSLKKPTKKGVKKLLVMYEYYSYLFMKSFSLGLMLKQNKKKNSSLKKHNLWRNTIVFKEEQAEKNIKKVLKKIIPTLAKNNQFLYLTDIELQIVIDNNYKISKQLLKLIVKRKQGFVFIATKRQAALIYKPAIVKELKNFFSKTITESLLKGQVASKTRSKTITGKVRVIRHSRDLKRLKHGELLVVIQTLPQQIPLIAQKHPKAIVTEEGGLTCHAAILSRELKIPCIVGAKNITKRLKTGQQILLDMRSGTIKLQNDKTIK